jgi:hypothetical protein
MSQNSLGKPNSYLWKPIIQLTKEEEIIKYFKSITLATKELKLSKSSISNVLRSDNKTCGGYKWRYQ